MPKSRISTLTGISRHPRLSLKLDPLGSPSDLRLFNCIGALNRSSTPTGSRFLTYAGITAAIGLAALPAFLTLAPLFTVGTDAAHAEGATKTLDTSATLETVLALSANSLNLDIRPSSVGDVFKTGKIEARVNTNSAKGYTLYLSDTDGNNSLDHKSLENTSITSTSDEITGSNMLPNTWGYTLGTSVVEGNDEVNNTTNLALTYSPIPRVFTDISTTDNPTPSAGDTTAITFGIKVDTSIPSGVYSGQVSLTAIPNYDPSLGVAPSPWVNPTTGKLIATMQEMTPTICANVPTPSVTATEVPEIILEDTRDNNVYKVRKLADGNCWMTNDLKLAGKDADHPLTLTSADSNVTTDFELPAIVPFGSTRNSNSVAYVSGGGTGGKDGDTGMSGVNGTVLYNFYAATAGSGSSLESGNAPQDICPKGWHLPNKEGNGSWQKLLRQGQGVYEIATNSNGYNNSVVSWGSYAGISTATANPVGLQLTGVFWVSELQSTANGYYWSRAAGSADNAYYLNYGSGRVGSQDYNNKGDGFGVRCVADDKEYLQSWTGCSGLAENSSITLKDIRDNKKYTVAKLGDNKCWMTKNLALGDTKTMTLDSNTTNLSSGTTYILPASTTTGFNSSDSASVYIDTSTNNYGGYYSWIAATAGTGRGLYYQGTSWDICPKGWRLPQDTNMNNLYSHIDTFKPTLAGYYETEYPNSFGTPHDRGSTAYYWTSLAGNNNGAISILVSSSGGISSGNGGYYGDNRSRGYSVRCVFGS